MYARMLFVLYCLVILRAMCDLSEAESEFEVKSFGNTLSSSSYDMMMTRRKRQTHVSMALLLIGKTNKRGRKTTQSLPIIPICHHSKSQ